MGLLREGVPCLEEKPEPTVITLHLSKVSHFNPVTLLLTCQIARNFLFFSLSLSTHNSEELRPCLHPRAILLSVFNRFRELTHLPFKASAWMAHVHLKEKNPRLLVKLPRPQGAQAGPLSCLFR